MREIILLAMVFLMLMCMITGIPAGSNSQTIVSYTRETGDVFPGLADIDVSVTLVGSAKFTCSDGAVLLGGSTECSIDASPESGTLTINYDIDTLLVKRSGSRSKSFNPEWLLVENGVTVYDEPPVTITVTIHGQLDGDVTVSGSGSATPSDITWSDWGTNNVTVSANANLENGQGVRVEVVTEYVVYFTVKVEVGPIDLFEKNSPSRGVSGSPTIQFPINVKPMASFTYSPTTPTIQDTINFEDTSEDPDGSITSWYWEFGDGTTSTEHNSTHQYADKGNYTVTLTVTDNEEATNTTTVTVKIYNAVPTANFTYSPAQPAIGEDIEFTDTSTDPEGELTSWSWDFGDEYTSTARNPTHKYETSGTYSITLTVTDDEGATDTISQNITIKEAPFYTEPWFFAAVGVTIIVVIVATALAWKKRK